MARTLVILFATLAVPPLVTIFTLIVTFAALVLVAVKLSIMALQFTAVYCVVWVFSACLAGIRTLTVTFMVGPYCCTCVTAKIRAGDPGANAVGATASSVTAVESAAHISSTY